MNAALRLSIKQWAPQDRPSDKLQNLGAEQMSDAELISLLVGCGTAQQSAVDVANNIRSARLVSTSWRTSRAWACRRLVRLWQRWNSAGADRWQQRSRSPTWERQ